MSKRPANDQYVYFWEKKKKKNKKDLLLNVVIRLLKILKAWEKIKINEQWMYVPNAMKLHFFSCWEYVKISFKNHKDLIRDDVLIRDMSHFLIWRPWDSEMPDSGDLRHAIDLHC